MQYSPSLLCSWTALICTNMYWVLQTYKAGMFGSGIVWSTKSVQGVMVNNLNFEAYLVPICLRVASCPMLVVEIIVLRQRYSEILVSALNMQNFNKRSEWERVFWHVCANLIKLMFHLYLLHILHLPFLWLTHTLWQQRIYILILKFLQYC